MSTTISTLFSFNTTSIAIQTTRENTSISTLTFLYFIQIAPYSFKISYLRETSIDLSSDRFDKVKITVFET